MKNTTTKAVPSVKRKAIHFATDVSYVDRNQNLTSDERLQYLRNRAQLFEIFKTLTSYDYAYIYKITSHFQYDKNDARAIKSREAVIFHDEVNETDFSNALATRLLSCQPFKKPLTNHQLNVLMKIRSMLRLQRRYGTSHIRQVKKMLEVHFNFPSIETMLREERKQRKIEREAFIAKAQELHALKVKRMKVKNIKARPYALDQAFINYICRPK